MSQRDGEDNDSMKAFFRGDVKIDGLGSKSRFVEIGHGIGIGLLDGSYSKYIKQLTNQSKEGNGFIYLGKAISEDKGTMSIVNDTEKFGTGDVPKLLVTFHNLINGVTIKLEWKNVDDNEDLILEQYYQIPSPHSMKYDWWDIYSAYFIGPEDLEVGDYKVEITSKENMMNGKFKELSSSIEFLVENKEE